MHSGRRSCVAVVAVRRKDCGFYPPPLPHRRGIASIPKHAVGTRIVRKVTRFTKASRWSESVALPSTRLVFEGMSDTQTRLAKELCEQKTKRCRSSNKRRFFDVQIGNLQTSTNLDKAPKRPNRRSANLSNHQNGIYQHWGIASRENRRESK